MSVWKLYDSLFVHFEDISRKILCCHALRFMEILTFCKMHVQYRKQRINIYN